MKKTILIALLLVGMTSTAFAVQVGSGSAGTALGLTTFKTSTNVKLFATATNTAYTCASKHTSGDTVYSSTGDSATITETQNTNYKGDDITNESGSGPS